jgi:hypothetical protein
MVALSPPLSGRLKVTLPFGPTSFVLEPPYDVGGVHYPHFHRGVDLIRLDGPTYGAPVLAAAAGHVSRRWVEALGGISMQVDHDGGLVTQYFHLSSWSARGGSGVSAGQEIGRAGSTGTSTGAHLLFVVMQNGTYLDPMPLIGGQAAAGTAATGAEANILAGLLSSPLVGLVGKMTWRQGIAAVPFGPLAEVLTAAVNRLGIADKTIEQGDFAKVAKAAADLGYGKSLTDQIFNLALPALLEPAFNLAIVAAAVWFVYAGIRDVLS